MSHDDTERIAEERSYRNRHSKTHRGVLGDSKRIDEDGVLGEQAFAAYMKLGEDAIARKGPVSSNFRLLDGTRVDVRSTRHPNGRLIVPPAVVQRGRIDAFVLAVIDVPKWRKPTVEDVRLIGWATPEEVQRRTPERISDRPNASPVHALWQDRLRPMEELRRRNYPQTQALF